MCYRVHSHFFTLQQLRATTQAGGVSGIMLKAQGDAFFIEIELRSGQHAILVTARGKEPRRFKNPLRALTILREIGIAHGQFDLSLYNPEQLNTPNKPAKPTTEATIQPSPHHSPSSSPTSPVSGTRPSSGSLKNTTPRQPKLL